MERVDSHGVSLNEKPLIVFLELTKACPLYCIYCRANAMPNPPPGELKTEEAFKVVEEVAEFGDPKPLLVLTGGDPLCRNDVFEILDYAKSLGVPTALAPAPSRRLLDNTVLKEIAKRVKSVSIGIDGLRETNNLIRRSGENIDVFQASIYAVRRLIEMGVKVQVNTAIMRLNIHDLPSLARLLLELGVKAWEVFLLVRVGRGFQVEALTREECEDLVNFLYEVARYGLIVRTVEAPFYRRVMIQRSSGISYRGGPLYERLTAKLRELLGEPRLEKVEPRFMPTMDGRGIIFVSSEGWIQPSGFLPIKLGNVRRDSLIRVYKEHPILRLIREGGLRGRCGICEYKGICGGSRARAYTEFFDVLAPDPACTYVPKSLLNSSYMPNRVKTS